MGRVKSSQIRERIIDDKIRKHNEVVELKERKLELEREKAFLEAGKYLEVSSVEELLK